MSDSEQEPDPQKRVPTTLWLILGIIVVVVFIGLVFMSGRAIRPKTFGPPAGAPASPADLAPHPLQRPNATGGSQ